MLISKRGIMLKKGMVIYQPKGRAAEYHKLAVNLYRGCSHGCVYCYAPDVLFMNREDFSTAIPRKDIIKRLTKDAAKAAADGVTGKVLLCFTCDPYQDLDLALKLTRQAIEILHAYHFNVTILTKGGDAAQRDFDLFRPGDEFATTLTFLNPLNSMEWEPHAALPEERIRTLKKAHDLGIKTWVSLEPVIMPEETLEIVRQTHDFIDLYKVGKLNYHPRAKEIDWQRFAHYVISVFEEYDCKYYMKDDLRRYL